MRAVKILFLIMFCLLIFTSGAYATPQSQGIPPEVQQAAQQGLVGFSNTFSNEKEHYGQNSNDKVDNLIVGQGYPYYKISVDAIKTYESTNTVPTMDQLIVPSNGYIFPIKAGNKPAGIGFVEYFEGRWQMVQVSSYTSFEDDLAKADLNLGSQEKKLVFDQFLGLVGLETKINNDEIIMGMQDSSVIGVGRNQKTLVSDLAKKMLSIYKNRNHLKAGISNGSNSLAVDWTSLSVLSIAIIAIIGIGIVNRKRIVIKSIK